ncbi:MAG TPA: MFS transporter, partial [Candidatus Limnocylindrales bacterium]|nr:MFS transporter [Candidatus Limnocylindrales bacterium]
VALVATWITLPASRERPAPTPLSAPIEALRHRGLLTVGLTALFYNFGFFTLLAFTPFPLDMSAHGVGLVFFGWGLLLAICSVLVAPWVQRRIGTFAGIVAALLGFAAILVAMAVWTEDKRVLVAGVVLAGGFLGVNNTLITETVMKVAPVERPVASAAYSFVRFAGGAVAPWLAGTLGERSIHLPFWVGAGAVLLSVAVLATGHSFVRAIDAQPGHGAERVDSEVEAESVTLGT